MNNGIASCGAVIFFCNRIKNSYEIAKAKYTEKDKNHAAKRDEKIYMITMVTEGRHPLFGRIVGKSEAPCGSPDEPHIELSALGKSVADEWWAASLHHPEVEILALQMMPDHLHGILFVKEKMGKPLGIALRGFKQSCNKHYRELVMEHHNEQITISRNQCLILNDLARRICENV